VAKLADADGSDGQQVSARFELWKSGGSAAAHAYNTAAKSIPKDSGDFSYSAVPALADGVWKWRVQARDGIATSAWAGWCEFTVDSKKPESAPTITPAAGNTYAVGAQPVFTLGPGTATGVTRYAYSLNGGTKVTTAANLTLPPLRYFGPNRLTVYSYDAAGNQSDPTDYVGVEGDDTFLVTGTTLPRDRWKADEGTGTGVGDLRPSGATYGEPWTAVAANALTLANGTAWGVGRRSDADPGEHVLTFDGVDDRGAGTATKVVDVSANWSVIAWLRPGARAARQVAVSEDSTSGSAFALGTIAKQEIDPDDGTTVTSQFFSVSLDHPSTSGADAVCDSDVAIEPGDWYSVAVAYSAPLQELTVRVVAEGTNDETTCEVPFTPASTAGVLRIGHAVTGGSATAHWLGDIDEVQAFEGTVDPGIHDTRSNDPR
jgi:hypothetical protein